MRSTVGWIVAVLALGASVYADDKEGRIQEGIRLHDAGDYEGAIVVYETILKEHPHDPTTVYELALSWMKRGKDLEALTARIEAELASEAEQHPGLPLVLGTTYDSLGQLEKGEAAMRRAVKSMPEDPSAHYNLGVNLKRQERWEDAAASFQEALRLEPDHKSAWFGLGASLVKLDKPARALFALARAVVLEPESERGHAAAGTLWGLLFTGVTEANALTITLPEKPPDDAESTERIAMSVAAANRYVEKWEKKSDAEFFAHALESVVLMFSEMWWVKEDPYWELTLPWFDDACKDKHIEALAYVLRRSAGDKEASEWIVKHAKRVKLYEDWKQAQSQP